MTQLSYFSLYNIQKMSSDKLNQLILNVKELIQESSKSTENCIKDIENEIDTKENQIRDLFAQNIDSVIEHFLQHHQTLFHHKKIQYECEEFSKHVEKAQKLNAYDEQQIEKSEKNLEYMKNIRNKLIQHRNYVKLAKKAALNIKEEKYNNSIKIINEYRKHQPTGDTPMKAVLPTLQAKVEEHLKKLLESFWEENRKKMLDIGKNCFQKMSMNFQEKMNIYQLFFGQNMYKSAIMNKSSISSFRCSIIERQNSSRIMKTSEQTADYLNKVMVRVNVEMSTLKKVKVMVVELNNQGVFNEMLRSSVRDYLGYVEQLHSCSKEQEFVDMLSELIGLMLVKREVCAFFDVKIDEKVFLTQMYIFIGRQIKSLSFILITIQIILALKEHFLIFHKLLNILDMCQNSDNYNKIIADLLKTYTERNLATLDIHSNKALKEDNLTHFTTTDHEKDSLLREMMDLGSQEFKFTSYVIFVVEYFLRTYSEVSKLIQESDINRSVIYTALKTLYERIIKLYGGQVLSKDQHYEIIQGEVNLIHINKAYYYLLRQLQIYDGVVITNRASQTYEQLVVKLTTNILEVIRRKLTTLMMEYHNSDLHQINGHYNQFVEWSLQFLSNITIFMRNINCPNYEEIAIESMREMCNLYWEYLRELKEFNLITIYNLDLDLSFIYKYCAKNFSGNIAILDRFKSLRQFYSLMLTNNIMDYADPQKRSISYPNLDQEVVVSMLRKYTQAKSTGGKIRQLKKREVEALLKKLMASHK